MNCPCCGSDTLKVYKTVPKGQSIHRYKVCKNCARRIRTVEGIDGVLDELNDSTAEALTRWGVIEENAKHIAGKHPSNIIKKYSDNLFPIMLEFETMTGQPVRDRAAFLVWIIQTRYPIPKRPNIHQNAHDDDEFIW